MAGIPAGCFEMGDHFDEGWADELPVHNVCISAFQMDVHQVTNAKYAECVAAEVCVPPLLSSSWTRESYYGNPAYDDFPVIWVNWHQATTYCEWAGKRLPTEAEWEYAARGGLEGMRFPWGGESGNMEDDIDCSDTNYGRWSGEGEGPCWDFGGLDNDTHRVGSYPANGYGLYDMAGNVVEWTNDWYSSTYYQYCVDNGIVDDPPGPAPTANRVMRGGSWGSRTNFLRVADRDSDHLGSVFYILGFRCARD